MSLVNGGWRLEVGGWRLDFASNHYSPITCDWLLSANLSILCGLKQMPDLMSVLMKARSSAGRSGKRKRSSGPFSR